MTVPRLELVVLVLEVEPASSAVRKATCLVNALKVEAEEVQGAVVLALNAMKKATCPETVLKPELEEAVEATEPVSNVVRKATCLVNVLKAVVVEEATVIASNASKRDTKLVTVPTVTSRPKATPTNDLSSTRTMHLPPTTLLGVVKMQG